MKPACRPTRNTEEARLLNFRRFAWAAAMLGAAPALATTQGPIVQTKYGQIEGFTANGINAFEGIPYAMPPVGNLRWVSPQPPAPFNTVFQATSFGSQCPQPLSQFGYQGTDEDCLYLNIQTPANATPGSKLPVMIWIHGGAFITGEGWDYDGTSMVLEDNVIIVTINYRLGLLGFMADAALAAADPHGRTGNYGLLDQQAAIGWVKQNIGNFGGNPKNITIFGESAGGQSVQDNLSSATAPKFQKAIIESGAYAPALPTLAAAEADAATRMASLGCTGSTAAGAACLRALSVTQLLSVVNPLTDLGKISPVVDGYALPAQPVQAFNDGQFQRVPVLSGSNHDEWRLFVILGEVLGAQPYTPSSLAAAVDSQFGTMAPAVLAEYPVANYYTPDYDYAALITDSGFACGAHLVNSLLAQYVPVYSYELTDPNAADLFLPYDAYMPVTGDMHASELPYIWPLLQSSLFGKGVAQFTQPQQVMAKGMRAAWTSFARYGRPLDPTGGYWPAYTTAGDNVQSLNPPSPATGSSFVADHNCDFWKSLLLQQAGLPGTVPY
jgi:para-nitrobenzyl esterase